MTKPEFSKVLAKYYHGWLRDCWDSVEYCEKNNDTVSADKYRRDARIYFDIIINNWDAIEFFSVKDNAFKLDGALPIEFRNYR